MVKKMQFDKEKYKGVIFDLDGTLIDSMYVWRKVVASIYEKKRDRSGCGCGYETVSCDEGVGGVCLYS
ncbi:hypothetical protein AAK706_08720 [Erysipelotrichaceae bacterium 66-17]